MDSYIIFAKYYDTLMGDRSNYITFINETIKKYNLTPVNILDVACGTGKILSGLDKKYNKFGIDLSENMLEIASNNVKKGKFYKQDMREISFNIKFDLISILFDSINHLLDFSDWEKVINTSYNLLNNNGIIIFDINTKYKLQRVSEYKPMMYEINNDLIFFSTENKGDGIVNWNIKFFENKGANDFKLYEENICEKSFEIEKIKGALKIFSTISIVDENFKNIDEKTERVFFICKK